MATDNNSADKRRGRLAGKVLLVTGAGSGIGEAVAKVAAAEGADVALLDYDGAAAEAVARALGPRALAIRADISSVTDVDRAVTEVVHRFDRIDVLANIAGVHDRMRPVEEFEDSNWQRIYDINVRGTALMMHRVLQYMLAAQSGAIINTASTSAFKGNLGGAAYSSSKGAIVSLTRQVAHDVAARGVRVNVVAPGPTATNVLSTATTILGEGEASPMAQHFLDKTIGSALSRVPMGRFGAPEEVARAIVFLGSDDASFITGATLAVDGGQLID